MLAALIFSSKKKETGCLSWKTAAVLQRRGLISAIAGLKTHPKCCFLLFIFICQRTTVLRDEPGTQTQHPRSDGAFFVQRVGSHLHVSLRSPPPTRRELARRATRGEKHRRYGAHNQNVGGNHTQLAVHHGTVISDLSQRAGSPRGPLGAKHNKSWNLSSREPTDVLESCSRTQQCRLFLLLLVCF